jgi:hypothetical protein
MEDSVLAQHEPGSGKYLMGGHSPSEENGEKCESRKLTMGPGVRRLGTIRITSAQAGDNCFSRKGNGTGAGGSNGSEVYNLSTTQHAFAFPSICSRPVDDARSAGCPGPQLLFQAFVAASTPNATMMPVLSNPSTAMRMAMILGFLLVGRKSP